MNTSLATAAAGAMVVSGADAGRILLMPELQIFGSVVMPDAVQVMDVLGSEQVPPKDLLHDESMFHEVAGFSGIGMPFGRLDETISVGLGSLSSCLPSRAIRPLGRVPAPEGVGMALEMTLPGSGPSDQGSPSPTTAFAESIGYQRWIDGFERSSCVPSSVSRIVLRSLPLVGVPLMKWNLKVAAAIANGHGYHISPYLEV